MAMWSGFQTDGIGLLKYWPSQVHTSHYTFDSLKENTVNIVVINYNF